MVKNQSNISDRFMQKANWTGDELSLLNGKRRPCAYTREEMAESLREAEADYKAGRYVPHEDLFKEYGLRMPMLLIKVLIIPLIMI